MSDIYLGTIAIEPARWVNRRGRGPEQTPLVAVSEWLDQMADAGFDGIEVWEPHLLEASDAEVDLVLEHRLPVPVFNSYVSLDDANPSARLATAAWAVRCGSTGIKYNVGNDPAAEGSYAERIAAWLDDLPEGVALLCECHHGISIADEPKTAATIFDAAGPVHRVQAIVHTHEEPDLIRARFDAYGDRISHVHVNFLDFDNLGAPKLDDITDRLASQIELLSQLGFAGTWTIEFTHGVLTDNDTPALLVRQAAEDLRVLRECIH